MKPDCTCGQVPCRRWRQLSSVCPGPVPGSQEPAETAVSTDGVGNGPYSTSSEEDA